MDSATDRSAHWGNLPDPFSPWLVGIGLGGNVGDVIDTFRRSVAALRRLSVSGRVSSLYRSAAIGPAQQDFLNAAVVIVWEEDLGMLLESLQAIEKAQGRVRTQRWGPRTLDLDILWAAGRTSASSSLTVPHPRLRGRRFALEPLVELLPEARHPHDGANLHDSLLSLKDQSVELLAPPPW